MNATTAHPSFDALLDYWLDDSDAAAIEAVDEHLLRCDACGQLLDELIALRDGVREAFRIGAVSAVTTSAFVQRLLAQGLKLREYRVPFNGSVDCTVAPGDEVLVSRLEASLHGVQRLDAVARLSTEPGVEHRLDDIPFDAQAGEVLLLPKLAEVRRMPAHTMELTLLAVQADGTRELGRYTFRHQPWPASR